MKICFLTSTPYLVGGIQRVVITLANALSKEHEVTIAYTYKPKNAEIAYDINNNIKLDYNTGFHDGSGKYFFEKIIRKYNENIHQIKSLRVLTQVYYPRKMRVALVDYIKANKFDVVIGVAGKYSMLLSIIKPTLSCRCIGWEHNSFDAYFHTKGQNTLWKQEVLCKRYFPKLDACIVLTDQDAKDYKKQLRVDAKRIYNPQDIESYDGKPSLDSKTVLFVGRMEYEQKGLHYLALIANEFLNQHSDWKFRIVGNGSGMSRFLADIDPLIKSRVIIEGEHNNVTQFYTEASMLVLTSKWEGFGLVAIEAMNYALPVISFNTSGPSEIIDDGVSGLLVECYSVDKFICAMNSIISDEEKYCTISAGAKSRSYNFALNHILKEWQDIIY